MPSSEGGAGSVPLAVLGMACRFPGAETPDAFWELLVAGGHTMSAVPDDRWTDGQAERYGFHGSFLPEPAHFDAAFFGMDIAS